MSDIRVLPAGLHNAFSNYRNAMAEISKNRPLSIHDTEHHNNYDAKYIYKQASFVSVWALYFLYHEISMDFKV